MAATAPQTLLTGANCFECYGASAVQMMRLAILSNILTTLNPMAETDPQSLITYGKCFECYGASIVNMMELALLDQISANVSTSGSGEIVPYTTTGPTADGVLPANLDGEAIAVKPGGSTFTWDSANHVWDDV
jgi:hypothetical protein